MMQPLNPHIVVRPGLQSCSSLYKGVIFLKTDLTGHKFAGGLELDYLLVSLALQARSTT